MKTRLLRIWRSFSPAERRSVRRVLTSLISVLLVFAWRARAALAVGAAAGAVVGASLSGATAPTETPAPIKKAWLTSAAGIKVERENVPCLDIDVNRDVAPKGVAHTTEGSWAGAMSVFRRHYAPHFMVGRDGDRVRIVQFCPLGKAAAALANRAGGVETNRWARAQIEIVGYSKHTRWSPDPGVLRAFAALIYQLRDSAGIPLRPVANVTRNATVWRNGSGWFGHAGVPENTHWDVGAFDWPAALKRAAAFARIVTPGHKPPKRTTPAKPYVLCATHAKLKRPLCIRVPRAGGLVDARLQAGWNTVTVRLAR